MKCLLKYGLPIIVGVCLGNFLDAQVLLNGSFENNSAVTDMINLTNPMFNTNMENTVAFGTFGNVDIITSSSWGSSGAQDGDWYISLTGGGTDLVSMELDNQLNAGSDYTISFWDRADPGFIAFEVEIGISDDPELFGESIYVAPTIPVDNVWTERVFTFTAPIDGLYITIQQVGGATGNWLHVDNFAFPCNVSLDLGANTEICEGETLVLDATNSGATYEWQDGSTDPTFEVVEGGTYSVEVSLDGCVGSDEIVVGLSELPTVDLGLDFNICENEEVVLIPTTENADDYLWQDGSDDINYSISEGGIYTLEVSNNCGSTSDQIEIQELETPVIDLGTSQDLCEGESIILDAFYPGAVYEWQDGSASSTFETDQTGNFSVLVTLNGCEFTDDVDVVVGELPTVDLGIDFSICENDFFLVEPISSNVDSYEWQDGSTGDSFGVSTGGLYFVLVSNNCGSDTDSVQIEQFDLPTINLGADKNICQGDVIVLDGISSDVENYLWNNGSSNPSIEVQNEGLYSVTVSNDCGSTQDQINVSVIEYPSVDLGSDRLLCDDTPYTIQLGNPSFDYLWQDGSDENQLTIKDSGLYSVEVSNQCGTAEDEVYIEFEDCSCEFFIPNSITINQDGINDIWKPVYQCDIEYYKLTIIDRWGEKVFETEDPEQFWVGTVDEAYVMDNAYTYLIEYRDRGPEIKKLYGHVVVLR